MMPDTIDIILIPSTTINTTVVVECGRHVIGTGRGLPRQIPRYSQQVGHKQHALHRDIEKLAGSPRIWKFKTILDHMVHVIWERDYY